jgi:hypothetical protein
LNDIASQRIGTNNGINPQVLLDIRDIVHNQRIPTITHLSDFFNQIELAGELPGLRPIDIINMSIDAYRDQVQTQLETLYSPFL